eukprot:1191676-Pyramimonas_sp.AAC.1
MDFPRVPRPAFQPAAPHPARPGDQERPCIPRARLPRAVLDLHKVRVSGFGGQGTPQRPLGSLLTSFENGEL